MSVNSITGEAHTYIANLNAAIDVACAERAAPNSPSYFVLEYSVTQGVTPAYIVSRSDGTILTAKYR